MKISTPVAIALDTLAIAVFALLARIAHQTDEMPLNFTGWLSTLWPFLVGVAPVSYTHLTLPTILLV